MRHLFRHLRRTSVLLCRCGRQLESDRPRSASSAVGGSADADVIWPGRLRRGRPLAFGARVAFDSHEHRVIASLRFIPGDRMKRASVAVALLLLLASAATAQEKQPAAKLGTVPAQVEAQERKLWEGLSGFGDKKAEVNAVDDFELISYTLSDFTVTSIGPNAALVTYITQYEGKSGGETSKAKSVFGEVWLRAGNEWKELYMQETYVK